MGVGNSEEEQSTNQTQRQHAKTWLDPYEYCCFVRVEFMTLVVWCTVSALLLSTEVEERIDDTFKGNQCTNVKRIRIELTILFIVNLVKGE